MLYLVDITLDNSPPDGSFNLHVKGGPGVCEFFTAIPVTEAVDTANLRTNILTRLSAYCVDNDLPAPTDAETVIMTRMF